jgi:hypothetical protein
MWRRVALVRTDFSYESTVSIFKVEIIADSFQPDAGSVKLHRNISSNNNHMASHLRRRHSS